MQIDEKGYKAAWDALHNDAILSDPSRNEFIGRNNSTKSAWLSVALRAYEAVKSAHQPDENSLARGINAMNDYFSNEGEDVGFGDDPVTDWAALSAAIAAMPKRQSYRSDQLAFALAEIREVWVGSECGEPVHAQEAYAISLCKQMYQIAVDALAGRSHKREIVAPNAKKLIWEASGETDVCADKEVAEIRVLGSHSGKQARYGVRHDRHNNTWQVCFWCGNIGMWTNYRLDTIDEAKLAAQEHYDSIVRENTHIEGGE